MSYQVAEGGVGLEFIWDPKPAVEAAEFDNMATALENMQVPLAYAGVVAAQNADDRFAQEGPGWAPWSDEWAIYGNSQSILVQTGAMRAHATDPSSYLVMEDNLYWNFESEKETVSEFGSFTHPARPFVGLSEQGEEEVMAGFARWLEAVIETNGGEDTMLGGGFETLRFSTGRTQQARRGPGGRFIPRNG